MELFLFTLKCHQAGFNRESFKEILKELGHITSGGSITSHGREMLEYFDLIVKLNEKQLAEEKEQFEEKFPSFKGEK